MSSRIRKEATRQAKQHRSKKPENRQPGTHQPTVQYERRDFVEVPVAHEEQLELPFDQS